MVVWVARLGFDAIGILEKEPHIVRMWRIIDVVSATKVIFLCCCKISNAALVL